MKSISISFALFLLVWNPRPSSAQETPVDSQAVADLYTAVFDDAQLGLSSGNTGLLAKHFAPQVAINLRGDESGTFSSNQAYYILQNFFKTRRISGFDFAVITDSDSNPYGNAQAELVQKGTRDRVQIYVALSFDGKSYVITQLTIF